MLAKDEYIPFCKKFDAMFTNAYSEVKAKLS
jgi:hypothetical protein